MLGQALDLALRELEGDPERAVARLTVAREQAFAASRELRELAQGLHPVGPLRSALAGLAAQSPLPLRVEVLRISGCPAWSRRRCGSSSRSRLSNAIKHAGATSLSRDAWSPMAT